MKSGIPFPEAGEGVSLNFQLADLAALQAEFGADYFTRAAIRCDQLDVIFIAKAVRVGGRLNGERTNIDLDEVDAPLANVAERVVEALYTKTFGPNIFEGIRRRTTAPDKE